MSDKIKGMPSKTEYERYRFNSLGIYETDDIPVYEFYHKKTESMPDGRYLMFLDYDLVLMDTPMPYDDLPIFRVSAGDIIGTPYGYTPLFDLLPIQDAVNMCFSTVLSNQSAFGVQSTYNEKVNRYEISRTVCTRKHAISKLLPTQSHTKASLARPDGIKPILTPAQMRVMQLRGCCERGNIALGKEKG